MNKSALLASMLLAACGGGGGYDGGGSGSSSAGLTYTVGGTVAGLNPGGTVVLQNNGGDNLSVSTNGPFTFPTALSYTTNFRVTVLTQPTGQTCAVASNQTGAYGGSNETSVAVTCR
jgi:hypothetical protein